jgi:flavin-dependent dehydrogenase
MYDAIVIGARCAGATTAMLLARAGLQVLLVDRAAIGSDIPHGHFLHRHAAGAELRDRYAVVRYEREAERVTGIVGRDARTGARQTDRARIVIGADGRNSALAREVGATTVEAAPTASCWYFSYFGGLPSDGLELYVRPGRVIFMFPTNDGLTGLFVSFAIGDVAQVRADPEPHGPGWALVGDAGCHKDPLMALGICDALRDAELLAEAIAGEDLASYERRRNAATMPEYHQNLALARFEPLPEEHRRLHAALRGNQEDTNGFLLATQDMVARETFFNDENLGRIMAGA